MAVTSAFFLAAQASAQAASNMPAAKADSGSDSSAQTTAFGKLLTKKRETAPSDSSSDSHSATASHGTAQPVEKAKDGQADDLGREVAAALAVFSGMVAPVRIQTQEIQPQAQNGVVQTISDISAQPQMQIPGDAGAQASLQMAAPQTENRLQPQTGPNALTQQAVSTQTTDPAVPMPTQQTAGQDTPQGNSGDPAGKRQEDELQIRYSDPSQSRPLFRQAETMPVKVGETPVVDTQTPDMDTKIADEIGKSLKSGAQHVELRLTPENLGTVTIDLTRSQDGSLQVVLRTSTDKAADLLTQHSAALSTLLQSDSQSSVQVKVFQHQQENLYFQQQSQNQSGGGQSRQQEHRQRQESENFLQQLRLGLIPADEQAG